ncbi:unnamed protein product [Closterium sp. NIES-65]|nr:unnamed protein product [Closterium sp. NIES-65]
MADRLNSMSVGDSVQLACRDSLLPFLQQETRAAGAGGNGGGGGGAGSDGGELKLLEVDESMLAELLRDGLVIKGTPEEGDEAVLCTRSSTFALKLVTTTNLLLLVPPHDENTPEKTSEETPEKTPEIAMEDSSENVDIQDEKLQNVTIPRVTAAAVASSHLEVVPVAPRLARLTHLLSACAYNERDEEEDLRGGEGEGEEGEGGGGRRGAGGMGGGMYNGAREGVGEGGIEKRGRQKGYTWQELVGRVQASEEEIRAGLEAAGAVKVGGERCKIGDTWRGVDPGYLALLLRLLLLTAAANDWPPRAIPEAAAVAAMCGEAGEGGTGEGGAREGERREGPRAELVRHCLKVFGKRRRKGRREEWEEARSVRVGGSVGDGDDGEMERGIRGRDGKEDEERGRGGGGEGGGGKGGECVWWELDECKVCRHYARQLLESGARWRLSAFMEAWAKKVPPAMAQSLDATWLRGLAILQHVGGPAAAAAAAAAVTAAATAAGKSEEEQECEPLGGVQSTWVRFLPSDQLPATAEHRFQALFTVQPMWALADLEPYLIDLQGPGQSVETLLMRFTRKATLGPSVPFPPLGDGSQATRGPSVPFPPLGDGSQATRGPRSPCPPGGRLSGHTGTLGPHPPLGDGSQATRGPSVPFPPWGTALRPHGDPRSPSPPGGRLSGHTGTLGPLPPLGDGSQATRGPSVSFPPWGTALRPHGDPRSPSSPGGRLSGHTKTLGPFFLLGDVLGCALS